MGGTGRLLTWVGSRARSASAALRSVMSRTAASMRGPSGNYQSYIEDLKRRKGPDADQPHRVAYKKLVRA